MGYKHSWRRPLTITPETFRDICHDFRRILPALAQVGVKLGDGCGQGQPFIGDDEVSFNGLGRCGCQPTRSAAVDLLMSSFFSKLDEPEAEIRDAVGASLAVAASIGHETLFDLDWAYRRCPGCCCFNAFYFSRVGNPEFVREDGCVGGSCKTNRRPYDLAVMAFLLIVKRHLNEAFEVWTDGRRRWWDEAKVICEEVLGYGNHLEDFHWAVGQPSRMTQSE